MQETKVDYKGSVTLSLTVAGKKIKIKSHNNGTSSLFKLLCQCLTGNYPGTNYLPQYISLQRSENGQDNWISFLNGKQALTGKNYVEESQNNWVASFSGVINYSSLVQTIDPSDTGSYRLVLLSGIDGSSAVLATLAVDVKDLAKISPGTNLIIEWKMMFSNAS